jgi:rRNA maturation endonuclease Nob1
VASYYDDNYGWYEIDSQDDIDFYHQVQRESVEKECHGCGRTVMLRPDYGYCNTCADKLERGEDVG